MPQRYFYSVIDQIGSLVTSFGYLQHYKLKKGDIVIDCGAYLGYFSIRAAKAVGDSGLVIAYEPDVRNFKILQKNIKSNKLNNVICINKGLYDKETTLHFHSNFFKSSLIHPLHNLDKTHEIDVVSLDSEFERLGLSEVNFIKMDIEGAELEVIDGAKNNLVNIHNLSIACYHRRNGKNTGEVLQPIFNKNGFSTKIVFPLHPTLFASKD